MNTLFFLFCPIVIYFFNKMIEKLRDFLKKRIILHTANTLKSADIFEYLSKITVKRLSMVKDYHCFGQE